MLFAITRTKYPVVTNQARVLLVSYSRTPCPLWVKNFRACMIKTFQIKIYFALTSAMQSDLSSLVPRRVLAPPSPLPQYAEAVTYTASPFLVLDQELEIA